MSNISFIFNGVETIIQCLKSDKMKDICQKYSLKIEYDINKLYFIYGSNKINLELTFEQIINEVDKARNKMNILVYENNHNILADDGIIKSEDIICPKCGDHCLIDFNDYKIRLYECEKGHEINNILLNEFYNTQIINLNNIICNKCNNVNKNMTYNKQFFKCLTCKQNMCPTCKSVHDNKHKIINYQNIKYICDEHNDSYYSYCNECKVNLCILCKSKHNKNHEIINFENIYPNVEEKKEELNKFKNKIDILNKDINEIIKILNVVKENINIYYQINYDLINNYEIHKRNYHILKNINCIKSNVKIINDIDEIIKEKNMKEKINYILNLYNKIENKIENKMKYNNNNNDNNEQMNINEFKNGITLKYNINSEYIKDNQIKIFGKDFVKNNKNNCKILCENKIYELIEYFNISNYNNKNNELEIKVLGLNNITDASYMFHQCNSLLSSSELSKLDTSNVTNMSSLFNGCQSLLSLPDISNWNVNNVTNLNYMFYDCYKLQSIPDISKWNINKVKNISSIFCYCFEISSLPDISKWNTNNVTDMFQSFAYCSSLKSLPDISKWNTSNVNDMGYMFCNCKSLSSLPNISNWNTNNVQNMQGMFQNCYSLLSLPDISKWNIDRINNLQDMFKGCKDTLIIPEKFKK